MAKPEELVTKASEPQKVDAYVAKLKHPLAQVVKDLRRIILSIDGEIGEEIKWNAPAFFYAGPMKPSDPKEYRRVERRWKTRPDSSKVTMRMDGGWRCFAALKM